MEGGTEWKWNSIRNFLTKKYFFNFHSQTTKNLEKKFQECSKIPTKPQNLLNYEPICIIIEIKLSHKLLDDAH